MSPALGLAVAAALVLIASGVAKIADPEPVRRSLGAARLPTHRPLALLLGVGEIAVGAVGIAIGGPAFAAVALAFVAFDVYVLRLRAVGGDAGCGCFGGESDVRPGAIHLTVNLVLAAGAGLAALDGADVLVALDDEPADSVAVLAGAVALAAVAVVAYTRLAVALDTVRGRTAVRA